MKAPSIYIIMARLVKILVWTEPKYMKTPQYTDMDSPKGDVLSILQTTHIELKPKDCILLVNYLGYIQFTPQLFPTVSIPKKVR